jgi:GAF domain-containing protein
VRTREAYVVPDLAEDLLQRANPLATDEDAVRCYAGAPLITSAGHVLGALCTIGGVPRDFCAADVAELQARADALVADLERACAAAAEPQAPAA